MADDASRITTKKKGDQFASIDYNKLASALIRLLNIKGDKDHTVNQAGVGFVIGHRAGLTLNLTTVICTAVDTPSDGLHTFAQCGLDGVLTVGGKAFTSCRLWGDFTVGNWLPSATVGSETRGLLFNLNGTNVVILTGGYYTDLTA